MQFDISLNLLVEWAQIFIHFNQFNYFIKYIHSIQLILKNIIK